MLTNNAQVQRVALFHRLMWKHLKEWQTCKVQHHMHAYATLQYLHSRLVGAFLHFVVQNMLPFVYRETTVY